MGRRAVGRAVRLVVHAHGGRALDLGLRAAALTRLHDPAPVLERNTEKSYLLDLAARGVPVMPTALVEPGQVRDLDALLRERGWDEAVVKPAVSAGSWRTYRVARGDRSHAATRARRLLLVKRCLVQPFLPSVIDPGERAIVMIDGEPSHAVRKRSAFEPPDVPFRVPVEPADDEIALARQALRAEGGPPPLYARVDVVREARGPVLMELELTEPRLFLAVAGEGAARRFAEAIASRLRA